MRDSDVKRFIAELTDVYSVLDDDLKWFAVRGYWVIRKVPNTKDQYYIACGYPPANVLEIYGIKL